MLDGEGGARFRTCPFQEHFGGDGREEEPVPAKSEPALALNLFSFVGQFFFITDQLNIMPTSRVFFFRVTVFSLNGKEIE